MPEDSIGRVVTANVGGILERGYQDDPSVVVWENLKVRLPSPRKGAGNSSHPTQDGNVKGTGTIAERAFAGNALGRRRVVGSGTTARA